MVQIFQKSLLSISVTALPIFLSIQLPVQAVKMAGSFNFIGQSSYCSGEVSASASVMIFKIQDSNGNYILDPTNNSTIQFSSPASGNCFGEWQSSMIPITDVQFGLNWTIKSIKFIGYSDPDRDPSRMPPELADIAYMTGFLDFMNMSGIIHTLLDNDGDEFGTTPPMNTDPSMQNTLDPNDFLSDTTTAMLPKPEDLSISKVPESTSTLSLFALGTLGAASTLKRKQKSEEN